MIKLLLSLLFILPSMSWANEIATRVTTVTTGFNNFLSASNTTVQSALDTIDNNALNTTLGDARYIELNGTSTTSAVIPFGLGIQLDGYSADFRMFDTAPTGRMINLYGCETDPGGGLCQDTQYFQIYAEPDFGNDRPIMVFNENASNFSGTGLFEFDGDVAPLLNVTHNLGNTSLRWLNIYSKFGNFTDQIASTLATGTSPFAITSTTVNTNLNADLLDGKTTGTSGNTVPLLDGTNTWSGVQTFSANPTLQNSEFIRNSSNSVVDIMPNGTSASEFGVRMDFASWGFGVVMNTVRASDGTTANGSFRWDSPMAILNNIDLNFGTDAHFRIRRTTTGLDTMQVGLLANAANSMSFAIIDSSDLGNANRSPITAYTDPHLFVYSSDATVAGDYVALSHDQTDANIDVGSGSLKVNAATILSSTLTSSGTTNLGWTPVSAADQACNTTCTSACVFGFNLTAGVPGTMLACTDATADVCLCAGSS